MFINVSKLIVLYVGKGIQMSIKWQAMLKNEEDNQVGQECISNVWNDLNNSGTIAMLEFHQNFPHKKHTKWNILLATLTHMPKPPNMQQPHSDINLYNQTYSMSAYQPLIH